MASQETDIGELDITDELIAERRAEEPGQTPEDMTPWQRPITAFIDLMNLWMGRLICIAIIPLVAVMVTEVFSRGMFALLISYDLGDLARALNLGPTVWVYDMSRMLGGVIFMAASGYALLRGVHIRADFIYRNWQPKTQATVDAVLYMGFYFPAMLLFFWSSLGFFGDAIGFNGWDRPWGQWEDASADSTWAPYLWPARIFMPIGAALLFLQGFPELFRAFHKMGKEREAKFLRIFPAYLLALAAIFVSVFYPDTLPLGDWLGSLFGDISISKPVIGMIMLGAMLFSIFIGFPISFTLIFLGFVFMTWGGNSKLAFFLLTLQVNSTMLDDQLVAVPLFIFMGIMMEQAGLMERLFNAVQMMMSRTRGALFIAVLFVSTIFAAATGIVGASVTILGIMAAKTMNRSKYDVKLSAGAITAGGTLGILIPPSIMLIVMGPVLEVPVTDLFRAAILPGAMLAGLYMIYTIGRCMINPNLGPILPEDEQPETSPYYGLEVMLVLFGIGVFVYLCILGSGGSLSFIPLGGLIVPLLWLFSMFGIFKWTRVNKPNGFYFSDLWYEFFMGLVPPTVLIAFSLGSIVVGLATPAEAAACGAFGAVILSLAYKKFTISSGYDALIKTLEITVLIMFLVAASNFFGAVFSNLGTPRMLTELLLSFDMSSWAMLFFILALIFLLGWPLEWVPIVLIIVPILLPVVETLDFGLSSTDLLVWFAILVAVNLQTAWLSPPVALSAYFLKGVVPEWDLKDIYLGMMQFMVIQLIGLLLIVYFPQIALWLPNYLYGGG